MTKEEEKECSLAKCTLPLAFSFEGIEHTLCCCVDICSEYRYQRNEKRKEIAGRKGKEQKLATALFIFIAPSGQLKLSL